MAFQFLRAILAVPKMPQRSNGLSIGPDRRCYSVVLPAALAFFHRAFAAAAIFALAAALIFRLGFRPGLADAPVFQYLAHLALAAAAIAARPARLILCFFLGFPVPAAAIETSVPRSSLILSCRASILSLMFAALRSAFGVNVVMVMVEAVWTGIRKGQARANE